jgi:hypothetical protein
MQKMATIVALVVVPVVTLVVAFARHGFMCPPVRMV